MTEVDTSYDPGNGFALDEYLCVKHGPLGSVKGGTMPKAINAPGGLADELSKNADKAPGPGHYFKEAKNSFKCTKGGTFSKMAREFMGAKPRAHTPSVGQYDTKLMTRTLGGLMTKNDRICAFAKMAANTQKWNSNGPGTYDIKPPDRHVTSPSFVTPRTESRSPRKATAVGPGHYNPSYTQVDFKVPAYSGSKEEGKDFVARMNKDRNATPFPWYKDMPESKVHDKSGNRKHCKNLLHDRQITPRKKPIASTIFHAI